MLSLCLPLYSGNNFGKLIIHAWTLNKLRVSARCPVSSEYFNYRSQNQLITVTQPAPINIDEVNGSAIVIQHFGHKAFGREIINEARVWRHSSTPEKSSPSLRAPPARRSALGARAAAPCLSYGLLFANRLLEYWVPYSMASGTATFIANSSRGFKLMTYEQTNVLDWKSLNSKPIALMSNRYFTADADADADAAGAAVPVWPHSHTQTGYFRGALTRSRAVQTASRISTAPHNYTNYTDILFLERSPLYESTFIGIKFIGYFTVQLLFCKRSLIFVIGWEYVPRCICIIFLL